MAVYADYTYYVTSYLGTAITESAFPQLALKASAQIDRLTFGRTVDDTDNTTAIKNAMCAIAEELQTIADEGTSGSVISSETVGSHSVTYAVGSAQYLTDDQRYWNAAKVWLANTGLMFAGFNTGEYGTTISD